MYRWLYSMGSGAIDAELGAAFTVCVSVTGSVGCGVAAAAASRGKQQAPGQCDSPASSPKVGHRTSVRRLALP